MLKFAIRNLLSRPGRTTLSWLGLTVAIAGMVGLFAVAEGLDRTINSAFTRIPGLMAMQPGAPIPLFSRVPADWREDIAAIDGVAVVNPEIWQRANVIDGKIIFSPPRFLFGTEISSRQQLRHGVYRDAIVAGRFLEPRDRGTYHAVVSRQIADEFGKKVGDTLRVNGYDMPIKGIYHCGSLLLDVAIILDIDQVRKITRFDEKSVSCFYIEQAPGVDSERLASRIQDAFRGRELEAWQPLATPGFNTPGTTNPLSRLLRQLDRGIKSLADPAGSPGESRTEGESDEGTPASTEAASVSESAKPRAQRRSRPESHAATRESPSEDDELPDAPLEVRTAVDWTGRFDRFSSDLNILLTVITGIGITVALLSIVNTMLMSVTERMVEFGILKANGWSATDVLKLITFESAVMGLAGGVSGAALGWLATQFINNQWPMRAALYAGPGLLLFSILFSTVLGMLGGLYPAWRAVRMAPMNAIRRG